MPAKLHEKTSQFMGSRSQLIALARLLDLIDADTARELVTQARANPANRHETQRDALQSLVESATLTTEDFRVLRDFATKLSDDLCWLVASGQGEDSEQNAITDGDEFSCDEHDDSEEIYLGSMGQSLDSDAHLRSKKTPHGGKHGKHDSKRGRSARARKLASQYEWNQPTIGTKVVQSIRRAWRSSTGILKYWSEAVQDWVASNLIAAGVITGCFIVAIVGLASWSYYGRSSRLGPGQGSPALSEATNALEPTLDRLAELKQQVADHDFDAAFETVSKLRSSDVADGRESADLAGIESGLLLAQGRDLPWGKGGETAWNEAGRILLADPQIDSENWRLQFATWLIHAADEDRALALDALVVNYPVKGSVNYQLKAWMQVRNKEADTALRYLSEFDNSRCEIGDLLYRAVANFYANNRSEAVDDFTAFRDRLEGATQLDLVQQLCFAELREFADKFATQLKPQAESAPAVNFN